MRSWTLPLHHHRHRHRYRPLFSIVVMVSMMATVESSIRCRRCCRWRREWHQASKSASKLSLVLLMLLSNINNWSPRILVVDKTSDFSMSTLDMGLNPSTHKVFVPDHPAEGVTIENKKKKKNQVSSCLNFVLSLRRGSVWHKKYELRSSKVQICSFQLVEMKN